jgi:hypothetical protein
MNNVVDDFCALVASNAGLDVQLKLATRMTDDERREAFFRLLEERRDREICMEALAAWRAAGGKWLHS